MKEIKYIIVDRSFKHFTTLFTGTQVRKAGLYDHWSLSRVIL